mgnify:FL=1
MSRGLGDVYKRQLLDYSNVIVHVFVPNTRTYYDLEHLWADGEPVDISEYLTPDSTIE